MFIFQRLPLPNVNDRLYNKNKKLVQSTKIQKDKIFQPKSIAIDRERQRYYTGSKDGNIYCVNAENDSIIESIVNIPDGKPLGLRLFKNELYFIEANTGLYVFNLTTKSLTHLLGNISQVMYNF